MCRLGANHQYFRLYGGYIDGTTLEWVLTAANLQIHVQLQTEKWMVTDLGIINVGLKPVPEVSRWLAVSVCVCVCVCKGQREEALEYMFHSIFFPLT